MKPCEQPTSTTAGRQVGAAEHVPQHGEDLRGLAPPLAPRRASRPSAREYASCAVRPVALRPCTASLPVSGRVAARTPARPPSESGARPRGGDAADAPAAQRRPTPVTTNRESRTTAVAAGRSMAARSAAAPAAASRSPSPAGRQHDEHPDRRRQRVAEHGRHDEPPASRRGRGRAPTRAAPRQRQAADERRHRHRDRPAGQPGVRAARVGPARSARSISAFEHPRVQQHQRRPARRAAQQVATGRRRRAAGRAAPATPTPARRAR